MTPREHAEELRRQAIKTLLAEKQAIEEQLKLLGYGKENAVNGKRRGRPPKATLEVDQGKEHQAAIQVGNLPTSRTD
jgi:hypothetical protein